MQRVRLLVAAALALAAVIALMVYAGSGGGPQPVPASEPTAAGGADPDSAAPPTPIEPDARETAPPEPEREAAPAPEPDPEPAPDATGGLEVECVWDDGEPAVGIEITCYRVDNGVLQQATAKPIAGTDGFARVTAIAPGTYELRAERAHERIEVVADAIAKTRFEFRAFGRVRGRVIDGDGSPVPDAAIEFTGLSAIPRAVATSGADGTFEFRAPSSGVAIARKAGFMPGGRAKVERGERTIELTLVAGGAAVSGLVVDPGRVPVANALVVIARTDGKNSDLVPVVCHTDAAGRFAATGVAVGKCAIYAHGDGFAAGELAIETFPGAQADVVLELRRGATVLGVVRDRSGKPNARIGVQAHREQTLPGLWDDLSSHFTYRFTMTDAEGRYELTAVHPGPMWLNAMLAQPKNESVVLADGQVLEWNPRDQANGEFAIRGTVLGPGGAPVTGWRVYTSFVNLKTAQMENSMETTDDGGRFELKELRDRAYDLLLLPPGSAWEPLASLPNVHAGGPEITWRVAFGLDDLGSLHGRVLATDGEPVKGLRATAEQDGVKRPGTVSPEGEVRFQALPPGSWSVRVSERSYGSAVLGSWELAANSDVEFGEHRLPARGRAIVRCEDASLLASTTLRLRERDGSNRALAFADVAGGRASEHVPPGHYDVLTFGPGSAPQRLPVEIRAGADAEVTMLPKPATGVQVTFVPANLTEARWTGYLEVEVRDSAGEKVISHTEKVDCETEYRWPIALAPGNWVISAHTFAQPRRRGELQVTVPAGRETPVEIRVVLAIE